MTTSPSFGQFPSTSVSAVERRLRRIDAEAEVGRAAERDRLAVRADQLSVALRRRRRAAPTSGSAFTFGEHDSSNGGAIAAVVAEVERGLAGDRRVGVRVDVGEDRVERVVDRVGEHEGAAHHRDAEDDRERRQDGAQLAAEHALAARTGSLGVRSPPSRRGSSCALEPRQLLDDQAVGEEEDAVGDLPRRAHRA